MRDGEVREVDLGGADDEQDRLDDDSEVGTG